MSKNTKAYRAIVEFPFWIDDGLWCPDCNSMAGVTCRECGGKGWTADPSFQ